MGNPNENSLEESAQVSASTPSPVQGVVSCSDAFCRCHDSGIIGGHCMDCSVLPTISVTIGLALADHTWQERTVEFECDPEFENNDLDLSEAAFEHWLGSNIEEAEKLAPSGWFLIDWTWKE
jgi:hypothetical protein